MRRLLALALAAAPLVSVAQVTPSAGTIWFDGSSTSPSINRGECSGTTSRTLGLTFTTKMIDNSLFPGGGEYRVFAASADLTTSPFCYTPPTTAATVAEVTPTATPPTTATSSATVQASALTTAAGITDCSADKVIYVCVAWYASSSDADSALKGYAKGQVNLVTAVPQPPVIRPPVKPGNEALYVTVDAGARVSGDAEATTFKAKAVGKSCGTLPSCDLTTEHWSSETGIGKEARISGLTNDVVYTVSAFAYSADGNASDEAIYTPANDAEVTPVPSADAWKHYEDVGGRDSGGCDAGPAGLFALLGAASLLRLGRKR